MPARIQLPESEYESLKHENKVYKQKNDSQAKYIRELLELNKRVAKERDEARRDFDMAQTEIRDLTLTLRNTKRKKETQAETISGFLQERRERQAQMVDLVGRFGQLESLLDDAVDLMADIDAGALSLNQERRKAKRFLEKLGEIR